MKFAPTLVAITSLIAFVPAHVTAQGRSLDRRREMTIERAAPRASQLDAIARLRDELGGSLLASFDETTGVTRTLMHAVGKLSGPAAAAPVDIAFDFVRDHLELLGLEPEDIGELNVCDRVYSRVSGATHVYFCQSYRGIPIFNAQLQVNVSGDGSITGVANGLVPGLQSLQTTMDAALALGTPRAVGIDEADTVAPAIDAADATVAACNFLGIPEVRRPPVTAYDSGRRRETILSATEASRAPIGAKLLWLPVGRSLHLVWQLRIETLDGYHVYDFTVDASRGRGATDPSRVLTRFDLVSDASYFVYERPVESPNHTTPLPPDDGRVLVVDPADTTASPLGWHDDGSQTYSILRGNNVHAYQDANNDNAPPASEPECAGGDCSFAINLAADPTTYTNASVANLFYWTNLVHDIQYAYGFDEAAGNFQVSNFGLGGAGGDPLRAEAQDGGGVNNANMFTPADGSPPRMQMFIWDKTSPRADSSLDAGIVVHEYGHGISIRQVGGPSNVTCLFNNQQPGEGLSDWWALAYTAKAGDTGAMPRGIATYVLGDPVDGLGIRTQPYSTDDAVNDHTYESINGMKIPHGVGEVWAQAAWEAYWALVDVHGFSPELADASGTAGNQRMMLYVNEGMKNTACSPTFTDVRDGILQAAMDFHGGEDVCGLWEAFAGFGLGVDAVSGGSGSTSPTNGFDIPVECDVRPRMTSPEPGTTLDGPEVTFTWDPNGASVDDYELWIGTSPGASDLFAFTGLGTATSQLVTGLPEDGSTLHVRLRFLIGGSWDFKDFTYHAAVQRPAIHTPVPGSSLEAVEVTFEWADRGTPVLDYWVYVGTTIGGRQILDSGSLGSDTHELTVSDLPSDGSPVHVRLWWFVLDGGWQWADHPYTAFDMPIPAMVDPVPGSTLAGPEQTFTWTDGGASVDQWDFWAGSTLGGQEYHATGPTTAITTTVTSLPQDGSAVYVRLNFEIAGDWDFLDFQYQAALGIPELTDPAPGSVLPGAEVLFQWTANGAPVAEWWLYLGSTKGGRDIVDSGSLGTSTSTNVTGIPTDSRTIHARLWYRIPGKVWQFVDFTYTAADIETTPPGTPFIDSPTPGSVLPGSTVTFSWNANGSSVSQWWLYVGTSPSANNIYDSGNLGSATSVEVSGIPTNSITVYVKLWYLIGGSWKSTVYEYTAADLSPTMTAPPLGAPLPGSNVTFAWEANPSGETISAWWLYVGSSKGARNFFDSGALGTATTVDVTGLPTDGRVIYLRLFGKVGTVWRSYDFPYTTATLPDPRITSPVPGSVLPGSTVTFTWATHDNAEPVTQWWLEIGSSLGARNIFDSGSLGTSQSVTVATLPTNGSTVYVRLWYVIFGRWEYSDFTYTAAGGS